VVFTLYGKETESEVIFVAFDSVVFQYCRRTSVRYNLVVNGYQATGGQCDTETVFSPLGIIPPILRT
jgi:hypothetical protein